MVFFIMKSEIKVLIQSIVFFLWLKGSLKGDDRVLSLWAIF